MKKTIHYYFSFFILLGGLIPFSLFADTVGFTITNSQIDESGASIGFTVERIIQSNSTTFIPAISVTYSTQDGTASAGNDYIATVSGTLNWQEFDTSSRSFSIPLINDNIDESDETFSIVLSNCQELINPPSTFVPCSSTTLINTNHIVTILDNDIPTPSDINFSPTHYNLLENDNAVTLTVIRSNNLSGAASVTYQTTNGSATAGTDYTSNSGTLSWLDQEGGAKTITVNLISDNIIESTETFSVALSNPTTGVLIQNSIATVEINDPPPDITPGNLEFSNTLISVNEGGVAQVTVTRTNGDDGAISVNYQTIDATAIAGLDYQSTSGSLTWADQESGSKTFTIQTLSDNIVEPLEELDINFSTPTNGATLQTNTIQVAISDLTTPFSPGNLVYSNTSLSIDEGNSKTITVTRTNGSDGTLSINFETIDRSATAGTDYQTLSGTLTWADQESGSRIVTISTFSDNLTESTENLDLNFFNASINSNISSNINIQDMTIPVQINDVNLSPGSFSFTDSLLTVDEGDSVRVFVRRSNGSDGAVSVNYQSQDNTAKAGDNDYQNSSGTLSWADGETGTKSFSITVLTDSFNESTEEFSIKLSTPTSGATILNDTTTIQIVNVPQNPPNQPSILIFSNPTINFDEGNTATITVTRTNSVTGAISVNYQTIDKTAQAGSDYQAASGVLSWADQEGGDKIFTIAIAKNNTKDEPLESFQVQLTNATGNTTIQNSVAEFNIRDTTKPGILILETPEVSVNEGEIANITVTRKNGSDGSLSITYQTENANALASEDYVSKSGTLIWADQEQGSKIISVATLKDTKNEATESFNITFNSTSDNSQTLDNATLSIIDVPPPVTDKITLSNELATVVEDNAFLEVSVQRQGTAQAEARVDYATSDITGLTAENTAIAGSDYSSVKGTLFWGVGDNESKTIRIPITQDFTNEENEQFVLELLEPIIGAILGNVQRQTITIQKNFSIQRISNLTSKQKEIATLLDLACTEPSNELITRCNEILLGNFSESEITDILEQLIPDQISSMGSSAIKIGGTQLDNLMSRLSQLRRGKRGNSADQLTFNLKGESLPLGKIVSSFIPQQGGGASSDILSNEKFGFFIHGKVNIGDKDQTERESGYEFSTLGVTVGMDYRLTDAWVMGAAFGYANSDVLFDQSSGEMNTNALLTAFYGSYYLPKSFYIDWTAIYGVHDYEMDRNIRYANNSYAASSNPEGDQYDIALSLGKDFNWQQWLFNSYARVEYQLVDIDSYQESGGHGFALKVGEQSVTSFTSSLGGNVIFNWSQPWGILSPGAQFEWVHQYQDNSRIINASFVNSTALGGILSQATDNTDRNYFNLGASINATFTQGQSAFILYESRVGQNNISSHTVEIGVRMSF